MEIIKLLDLSNPKLLKDTLNQLILNNETTLNETKENLAKHLEIVDQIIADHTDYFNSTMQQYIEDTNTIVQEFKDSTNAAMQKHIEDTDIIVKDFKEYAEGVLANVNSTIGDLGSVLDEINGEVI